VISFFGGRNAITDWFRTTREEAAIRSEAMQMQKEREEIDRQRELAARESQRQQANKPIPAVKQPLAVIVPASLAALVQTQPAPLPTTPPPPTPVIEEKPKPFSAIVKEGTLEFSLYHCEHVGKSVTCPGLVWNLGDEEAKLNFNARGIAQDDQGHESDIPFSGIDFANPNRYTTLVPNSPVRFSVTFLDKSKTTSKKVTLILSFRWKGEPGSRTIPNVEID
jgi:hypothetical protein